MNVTVLCMHTSPLAQPGLGDGGGMNVYVRELSTALARAGVTCDVFTRADDPSKPATIAVEPGFRVHHVEAGPVAPVPKEDLPALVAPFARSVAKALDHGPTPDIIHANYWLSGVAGHQLKHELGVPLVTTFHTLARVKAAAADHEPEARAMAEQSIIGCSDVILASCAIEADQLSSWYGADPARIEEVPLGVDHAYFSPGSQEGARVALGLGTEPVLLFVGRIQPLKGVEVAVRTLAALTAHPDALLLIVGGPSGRDGDRELVNLRCLIDQLGVADRVRFVPPQPHHLLGTYYRAADAVLVPSRSESFGLVALEAGACGTPVVAAAVGGLLTLVDDGRTGYLIEGRDPADYAVAVAKILGDPSHAAALSAAAAERSKRYAWSYTAARLRRLYGDLRAGSLVACG